MVNIKDNNLEKNLINFDENRFDINKEEFEKLISRNYMYRGALREVSALIENFDDEFSSRHDHNPIHHVDSRIKTVSSILNKAQRKQIEMTADEIKNNIFDIAGIRVVCNYVEDVYSLCEIFESQKNFEIIKKKDYIENPKPNGYRSLHIVVNLPILSQSKIEMIPVEVQLRTLAMDMWASLEHEMFYKSSKNATEIDRLKLKICADDLAKIDSYMQGIYKSV